MKIHLLLLCGLFLLACTNSPAPTPTAAPTTSLSPSERSDWRDFIGKDYLIDDQHSYIGFKIKYFGYSPVRGRFNEFDGTVFYNPDNLMDLSVSLFIDVNSINTGNERRDNDLKKEGTWFDAAQFPQISFKSTDILPKANGGFDLIGEIQLKGITKVDTFQFDPPTKISKDWAGNDQVDFSGRIQINRQDYGVFGGDFWSSVMENGLTQLSDEVEIELDIHCRRANYQIRYQDSDSTEVNKIVLDQFKKEGLEATLQTIDQLHQIGKISAGKLSTIGYTLNAWEQYEAAHSVFNKRLSWYPEKVTTRNQLGITDLYMGKLEAAKEQFLLVQEQNPQDSRAVEYLRLMER